MATQQQIDSFHEFASRHVCAGHAELSMDELFDRWQAEHTADSDSPKMSRLNGEQTSKGESFITRVTRLEEKGNVDSALDLLYDGFDQLLRDGRFQEVDAILRCLDVAHLSGDILIGVLTATLPARSRLASRDDFRRKVQDSLTERDAMEEGLLTGL